MQAIDLVIEHFGTVKINVVIVKGVNDIEIVDMVDYFKDKRIQLRFIEYMDVVETNDWNKSRVITSEEIIEKLSKRYSLVKIGRTGNSTSEKWSFSDHIGELAFISSISNPFCSTCTRGRLSADGKFFTCLFSSQGYDVRKMLRNENDNNKIFDYRRPVWY